MKRSEIDRIAALARLEIVAEDVPVYQRELTAILEFVEQLSATDTEGVEPMAHPLDACQRLRPDRVTEKDQREIFQQIAPEVDEGLYLVPQVIE